MTDATPLPRALMGIRLLTADAAVQAQLLALLRPYGLDTQVDLLPLDGADAGTLQCTLQPALAATWMPDHDTLGLSATLALDSAHDSVALEHEILLTMLITPVPFVFPSVDELVSAVRVRRNIAQAARKTALAFNVQTAERPEDYWRYDEDHGFVLLPGRDLIEALQKATQPEVSGKLYSFSCYRATEYVILLGIAQELRESNPALLAELQRYSERRAIRSGRFHDVFLHEYGTMEDPLPLRYYVPGDRLWFRNPDERSADATGFEGSWVFYMGGGLFSNFWAQPHPFTLTRKCVEIYHWRDGAYTAADGSTQMNDAAAEAPVPVTLADPVALQRVLDLMVRPREPKGVYGNGGCIDTTREYPRWLRPGTGQIVLPKL